MPTVTTKNRTPAEERRALISYIRPIAIEAGVLWCRDIIFRHGVLLTKLPLPALREVAKAAGACKTCLGEIKPFDKGINEAHWIRHIVLERLCNSKV